MKPTTKEVWDSLKMRFIGTYRLKAACLVTLKGEFDKLIIEDTRSHWMTTPTKSAAWR
jgi:hypothetical protein